MSTTTENTGHSYTEGLGWKVAGVQYRELEVRASEVRIGDYTSCTIPSEESRISQIESPEEGYLRLIAPGEKIWSRETETIRIQREVPVLTHEQRQDVVEEAISYLDAEGVNGWRGLNGGVAALMDAYDRIRNNAFEQLALEFAPNFARGEIPNDLPPWVFNALVTVFEAGEKRAQDRYTQTIERAYQDGWDAAIDRVRSDVERAAQTGRDRTDRRDHDQDY